MASRPSFSAPEAQPFFFQGDDRGVLMLHGFTGSAAHMRLLGEAVRDMGCTVRGINLPGHAATPETMAETGWQDWLDAARAACMDLRRSCRTVTVVGLSMGGVLALILAELGCADRIVTISAPMGVKSGPIGLAPLLAPVMPRLPKRRDPVRERLADPRYDLGYDCIPTRCAAELNVLIRQARRDLSLITCPVLAVQSRADRTITPDSLEVILAGVRSKKREKLWLTEAPHVATIAPERAAIIHRLREILT